MTPERWRQIEELYRAARDPEKRASVLAEADPELRREVEGLLASELSQVTASMALPVSIGPGATIDHYRVEAKLGEGGMGSVYRALDTKLNRPVAIKFLSSDFADADARRRFQREAQMASSLNHPHIVTVYDAGEIDGRQYLVTEYIDGGTLKEWAAKEHRSPKQVVDLLTGVADGLAAAHRVGIIHRDIKPGNILVATNGYAKLADFGLAKLAEGTQIDVARTLSEGQTKPGMIVGSIAYMSPEQASGVELDARSDIFSFGVLLYELLAGKRPFSGATDLELLKTIIHGEPQPLGKDIAAPLRSIIEKAIEKDPAERYQTMRDMVVDLKRLGRPSVLEAPRSTARAASGRSWPLAASISAIVLLVVVAGLWEVRRLQAGRENPLANAAYTQLTDFEGAEVDAAISPDGKLVAFISDRDGRSDAWMGQIGTNQFRNLTKQDPDPISRTKVRSVGFAADGEIWLRGGLGKRLRLLPLAGDVPRVFLGAKAGNAAWSPDGKLVVYHTDEDGDPMFLADSSGENPRPLVSAQPQVHNHFPTWSQDGRWIYFVRGDQRANQMDLWRIKATGGELERLTQFNSQVSYPAPINAQTVLFVMPDKDGSGPWLWALDVDSKVSRRISEGLDRYTSVSATADGHRLVATAVNPQPNLWSVPILDKTAEEGQVKPYPLPTTRALAPRFAASGLFYLSSRGGGYGLWRFQNGQAAEIWKGSDGALLEPPAISADGHRVAIVLRKSGKPRLYVIAVEGTDLREVTSAVEILGTPSWSPDGNWIVTGGTDTSGEGLFRIPAEGGVPTRLLSGPVRDPLWSPDNALIVYTGENHAAYSPLRAATPNGEPIDLPQIQVRIEGERYRFSGDGKTLVYMQGSAPAQNFWQLNLVTKQTRQLTNFTKPTPMRTFDITPDGTQIVFDRLRENSDIVLIDLPKK